jgi:hypothetical protein
MSRAFRLTSSALVLVCALAGVAAAKPSIAVLGLEVIDKSGTPSNDDVTFAKNLTEGLRARAKIGGPYTLAPTGDKELIDLKLLKGCDDEKPSCMASIGSDLAADFLIYGSVTKKGKVNYDISIAFLDVHAAKRERTVPSSIPVGTGGVALQNTAKKIYHGLTGQSDSCTITIKAPGVDRGEILLNGKAAGNITSGVGSVNGLSEGKYAIAIEAPNFHRYTKGDVQCTGGETTNISATMDKSGTDLPAPDKVVPPGQTGVTPDKDHEITGSISHQTKPNTWKYVAIGGGVLTAASLAVFINYGVKLEGLGTSGSNSFFNPGSKCVDDGMGGAKGINSSDNSSCSSAKSWSHDTYIFGITAGALGAFTIFSVYKAMTHSDESYEQSASGGHRKHHEAFAITPVVSPSGAGATFRMEW